MLYSNSVYSLNCVTSLTFCWLFCFAAFSIVKVNTVCSQITCHTKNIYVGNLQWTSSSFHLHQKVIYKKNAQWVSCSSLLAHSDHYIPSSTLHPTSLHLHARVVGRIISHYECFAILVSLQAYNYNGNFSKK